MDPQALCSGLSRRPQQPPPRLACVAPQVYCIRHLRHGNKYACKTLGKKKLLSQLDAEDIKKEIEVSGNGCHVTSVKWRSQGRSGGQVYVASVGRA